VGFYQNSSIIKLNSTGQTGKLITMIYKQEKKIIYIILLFICFSTGSGSLSAQIAENTANPAIPDTGTIIIHAIITAAVLIIFLIYLRFLNKKRIEKLKNIADEHKKLTEDMPVLISKFNTEFEYTYTNRLYEEYYNVSENNLYGESIFSIIHEDDKSDVINEISKLTFESPSNNVINRTILPNGEIRWQEWINRALFDEKRMLTGYQSIGRDITERKQIEQERELLFSAIDHISDMIVILNVEGNIQYVNNAFVKITGYSKADAIGHSADILKSGEHDEEFYDSVWAALSVGKPWSGQFINKKKDGSLYTEQTIITPLFNSSGDVINYIEIKRDITKELQLQEQLHHKSKMDVVGQLAGGIAHDFNNVLNGIMSAAQLLTSPKQNLNEKSLRYAKMIQEASFRASKLSKRLLTFSTKNNLAMIPVDIHSIINETDEVLKSTVDKKIEINTELNAEVSAIVGNDSELHNALLNLCINAVQAMADGGTLIIRSGNRILDPEFCSKSDFTLNPGEYCWVEIEDTGRGIAKENIKKIFEPFFTTKVHGKGTGLGLAAVYSSVQSHSGAIEVESHVGKGSVFRILLPVTKELITDSNHVQIYRGNGTILFVDDEETNRIVGTDILSSLGYDVLVAANGIEALEIYKKNKIDLVLLDMIMPEMNGRETFFKLKEINNNCKIILSSGYSDNADIEILRANGLLGEIHKPYRMSELSILLSKSLTKDQE